MHDKESFLSRWSRRKLAAKEHPPDALPVVAPPVAAPVAPPAPVTEPTAPRSAPEASSEYREFFDPQVQESLRHLALKKLFNDPQFNVMDGLDTYIDDYSKPDPIPEAMLRQLNQAKELFLFNAEDKPDRSASDGAKGAGEPAPASPALPADTSSQEIPAAAGVPGADTAPGAATTPPPDGRRND